jgi:hypothetical protein
MQYAMQFTITKRNGAAEYAVSSIPPGPMIACADATRAGTYKESPSCT